jgi:hypothetical protein
VYILLMNSVLGHEGLFEFCNQNAVDYDSSCKGLCLALAYKVCIFIWGCIKLMTCSLHFPGHEFAFVAFLFCLFKIGAWKQDDLVAVGLKVFPKLAVRLFDSVNSPIYVPTN